MRFKVLVFLIITFISVAKTEMVFVSKGHLPDIGKGIINVEKDFYIAKYEVTQKDYSALMGNNPSKNINDNNPVENVTWYDAIAYCNKLSEKEGLLPYYKIEKTLTKKNVLISTNVTELGGNGYRLPSSVEWEYAARGGIKSKGYKYSGSNALDDVAWYVKNSGDNILLLENVDDFDKPLVMEKNNIRTHEVGTKLPNELGIYDMSGNVWEWSSARVGMANGNWYYNIHGGSFANSENTGKSNFLTPMFSEKFDLFTGFRVLREE